VTMELSPTFGRPTRQTGYPGFQSHNLQGD
jgi:hypothetical protein